MTDYKERFKTEYRELKERYRKLNKALVKIEAGTCEFEANYPVDLLEDQLHHMGKYLHILEVRAEHEQIDLEEDDDRADA